MLVAAAVCPCPPLLVPEVAAGAAPELDAARTACADALSVLAASRPDRLIVVGPAGGYEPGSYPQGARGTFRGYGVDIRVTLGEPGAPAPGHRDGAEGGSDDGEPESSLPESPLPGALAVAAWLLDRVGWAGAPLEGLAVDERLPVESCTRTGRELADRAPRVALLVMGDGSACRTVKAPGYLDERAAAFDARAARALGAADTEALKALDISLADELKAAGRAAWQVLAGAGEGADLDGRLLYEDAPYGVGYVVAAWS
ncbi:class III extradiol dioxygenase subunit B-like domain-containing protein [Streptomyces sp. NPDC057445]|uniref:class III extradiol dioxygenase subunit B-like domain-containing protein n=1 Tax=Streptomyces sp. NPDC057445 TaxID=3346136 RepID=UPI003699A993